MEDVIALGDTARDTVGFLPREAFLDYAKKDQILACIEENELLGYLLFRRGKAVITIVQLCVSIKHSNLTTRLLCFFSLS